MNAARHACPSTAYLTVSLALFAGKPVLIATRCSTRGPPRHPANRGPPSPSSGKRTIILLKLWQPPFGADRPQNLMHGIEAPTLLDPGHVSAIWPGFSEVTDRSQRAISSIRNPNWHPKAPIQSLEQSPTMRTEKVPTSSPSHPRTSYRVCGCHRHPKAQPFKNNNRSNENMLCHRTHTPIARP